MAPTNVISNPLDHQERMDSSIQIATSKGFTSAPEFSPDGEKIAFVSCRSATMEIWTCKKDGSDLLQVTHLLRWPTGRANRGKLNQAKELTSRYS